MSGGSETTTTEQTREPWAPASNIIQGQVLPGVSQWGRSPLEYTGPEYVDPTQDWQRGLSGLQGWAGGQGTSGVIDPAMERWRATLDPSMFLSAPGASAPLDWFAENVGRNLDENIRPGYGVEAALMGQHSGYSGMRAQNERLAERNANEAIADFGRQLTGQLWGQGLGASANAMGMAPGMYGLGQQPFRDMMGLDAMQRGEAYTEQGLDNARREFRQMEPLQRAQSMWGILGPAANLGGTMVGTQTQERQMGLGDFLGPAMMLGMGAMGGGFPLLGAGGGGMLGGGSLFGNMMAGGSPAGAVSAMIPGMGYLGGP